jgi:hypothetical protein
MRENCIWYFIYCKINSLIKTEKMLKYAVGLDIGSKEIYGCLSVIDNEQKVKVISSKVISNSKVGYKNLVLWIDKNTKNKTIPLIIGMEATGIYHEECAYYLHAQEFSIQLRGLLQKASPPFGCVLWALPIFITV